MPDFFLKRGDTLSQIQVQLFDGLGNPVNLFGATVKFIMRSFATGEVALYADAQIVGDDPSQGIVQYTWVSADTSALSGDYYAEWQVAKSGNAYQTFPVRGYHLISVQDDLDSPLLSPAEFTAVRMVRGYSAENSQDTYSDSVIASMIERNGGDLFKTAAEIWRQKAAVYSELVDTAESGNSMKLSQLYQTATQQADKYEQASADGGFSSGSIQPGSAGTRAIERV